MVYWAVGGKHYSNMLVPKPLLGSLELGNLLRQGERWEKSRDGTEMNTAPLLPGDCYLFWGD